MMTEQKSYYVYLMTNIHNRVLYLGVTNNVVRCVYEHKNKLIEGFTYKYNLHKLVYFEETSEVRDAIGREKQIKKWRREKKNELIQSMNPEWDDLSAGWYED